MSSGLTIACLIVLRITFASWSNVLQKQIFRSTSEERTGPDIPFCVTTAWRPLDVMVTTSAWMALFLSPWWLQAIIPLIVTSGLDASTHLNAVPLSSINTESLKTFWFWMFIACLLEVPGNVLLLRSISRTDLSIFGPLTSFKPLVGMLLGWFVLHESPTFSGLLGMLVIIFGSILLTTPPQPTPSSTKTRLATDSWVKQLYRLGRSDSGVRDRLIAVALTASGSVFLKMGMRESNPMLSLAGWSCMSFLLSAIWIVFNSYQKARLGTSTKSLTLRLWKLMSDRRTFWIGVSMVSMQGLTILVFQKIPVGYALAMFQLGSLVSVYLGYRIFGEKEYVRRMLAAGIMLIGAVLIVWS